MVALARLPPRIRPAVFAFGTLADGFLPFDGQEGEHVAAEPSAGAAGGQQPEIKLASVVMKAVQSSRPGLACSTESGKQACGLTLGGFLHAVGAPGANRVYPASRCLSQSNLPRPAAGKLGDDRGAGKMQFDRRLPPEAVVSSGGCHGQTRLQQDDPTLENSRSLLLTPAEPHPPPRRSARGSACWRCPRSARWMRTLRLRRWSAPTMP